MTSQINVTNIDSTFPIPGRDNDSQGFRTNFGAIKIALAQATTEINNLMAQKADLIEPSFLSNTTPSFSTNTGALTVAGGVGIAGDLWVGGNVISGGTVGINSGTAAPTTQSGDVVFSGTYGNPSLLLKPFVLGNKAFAGTLSVGAVNAGITYPNIKLINVISTATFQTGAYIYGGHNNFTNITLDTFKTYGDGGSQNYISFIKSPNNTTSTISTFRLDSSGSNLEVTGNVNFIGNVRFTNTVTIGGQLVNTVDGQSGPVVLSTLTSFTRSLTTSGYQKLPGGLIMQWGYSATWTAVSFPTTFTTIFTAVASRVSGNGAIGEFGITYNKDGITPGTNGNQGPYSWMAFGV